MGKQLSVFLLIFYSPLIAIAIAGFIVLTLLYLLLLEGPHYALTGKWWRDE